MYCTNCGKEIEESICPYCGNDNGDIIKGDEFALLNKKADFSSAAALFNEKQISAMKNWTQMKKENNGQFDDTIVPTSQSPKGVVTKNEIPYDYEPISMWGYFGYDLLFSIPVIGWIINVVFAFGTASNINLKNYARSKFCVLIVYFILFLLFFGGLSDYLDPAIINKRYRE